MQNTLNRFLAFYIFRGSPIIFVPHFMYKNVITVYIKYIGYNKLLNTTDILTAANTIITGILGAPSSSIYPINKLYSLVNFFFFFLGGGITNIIRGSLHKETGTPNGNT